ncbi:MAG: hypothetical protein A2Z14_06040 [Chloroflexi bacterium RBG_16_48_8]|nr:MAG: hypothetical protein A2Z14_06040 [Chloroflexi bacterium RBG_16_48_8]
MIRDRFLLLSPSLILLLASVILLSACGTGEIGTQNTTTPTILPKTPLPEPTRTLSLDRPDTVRETYAARATEDASKPPTLTPGPPGTPTPIIQPSKTEKTTLIPTFTSIPLGELTLEDYLLAPETYFTYSSDEREGDIWEFILRIPDTIYNRRKDWWESAPEPKLTLSEINKRLSAFGYRVEETGSEGGWTFYGLFEGQNLVQDDIRYFRKIIVNQSGTDFALIFNHGLSWDLGYARKGFVDPGWNTRGGYDWFPDVDLAFFIGDDLIRINFIDSPVVIRNDEIIYIHDISYIGPPHCPLMSFQQWKDQWVMEVDGEVIVNSGLLHQKYGYTRAFHWQLLNGKPFFFFEKDGMYGISFNEQVLPVEFDEIAYAMCGVLPPTLGPRGNSRIVGFYGRKGGYWHYYELGLF